MDWFISPAGSDPATRTTEMLAAHLRRHAADPDTVDTALADVQRTLTEALAARRSPLRLHLDWTTARPTVELSAVDDEAGLPADVRPDRPIPVRHRPLVEERAGAPFAAVPLPVERRVQETFLAGPPPTPLVDVDPRRDGPASVAVALVAAVDAHPTVSGPQAASLAGAILAQAVSDRDTERDAHETARLIAEVHGALGSDAQVAVTDEGDLEMSVSHCPFGPGVAGAGSLCHVTAGLAGQLAARVHGQASVVLDEAIAAGDPECHLHIRLRPGAEEVRGQNHQWPTTATNQTEPAPHLDLSLSLPRESSSVPVVRRLAAQALRAFGVDGGDIDDVQLAITEACANVVEHATDADTYEVKVELAANRCAITVVDQGMGFDATAVPSPAPADAESGRGLMLMRALVDNLAFQSEPQAGAVVHMVKSLRFDEDHPLWRRESRDD
jgi:serine/threonine-protein kinase RsbW